MKKLIKNLIAASLVIFGTGMAVVAAPSAMAANPLVESCANQDAAVCDSSEPDINQVMGIIVNTLLFLIGAVAVIMIIVAGFRYVTSGGDSGSVTAAKNTILYSIIGLLVAVFAYAIVNWVLDLF